MSASLVGSEMCIRDRSEPGEGLASGTGNRHAAVLDARLQLQLGEDGPPCLLYTSDAADDM
eukprot:15396922-Alexandrium_andersonii.AAC.1